MLSAVCFSRLRSHTAYIRSPICLLQPHIDDLSAKETQCNAAPLLYITHVSECTLAQRTDAGQAADLSGANSHSRSVKRGRSSDNVSEHAGKRSRLGMPAVSRPHVEPAQHPNVLGFQDPQEISFASGTDAGAGYQGVLQMVQQVQSDQVSPHACQLKGQLRNLDAAEGIGMMAWLIDGMLSQRADPSARELITDWVMDLAEFAKQRAQSCRT